MSYTQNLQHIVFGTKYREKTIPIEHERELYAILFSLLKNKNCFVHRIGGMPDHVHILVEVPPTISIADLVKYIKAVSSKELRENKILQDWRGWGVSYCALSKSAKDLEVVKEYIKNQKEHHSKVNFINEYQEMAIEAGAEPNAPYFPR